MSRRSRLLGVSVALALSTVAAVCAQPRLSCPRDASGATKPFEEGIWQACTRSSDGRPHGPVLGSYKGGGKRIEGQYQDGAPVGRWRGWHRSGRAAGEADFQAGQLDRLTALDERGTVVFDLDVKAGRLAVFDDRGRRRLQVETVNGVRTEKRWDDSGALITDASEQPEPMSAPDFVNVIYLIAGGNPG